MSRTLRPGWIVAPLLISAACAEDISPDAVPVRVMTYNIGNPNVADTYYPLRLKDQDYEDYVGAQIRAKRADIVFLQEVLPPTHCETFTESNPALTCWSSANRPAAVQRILGDDYSIACDARQHVECVGVRTDFGTVAGVPPGGFVLDGATTPPLPLDPCVYSAGECTEELCDAESTVSALTVKTAWGVLRVVHVHPNAAGKSASSGLYFGDRCRGLQLRQVFDGLAGFGDVPLVTDDLTLVAGDFNVDPVRFIKEDELDLWTRHVGVGRRFQDFTPVDANGAQHATNRETFGLAIDHVLAERATGACQIWGADEFGTNPANVDPLDKGFDWNSKPDGEYYASRIDHFAITCDFALDFTTSP
ncbi:MAG: hypothetical protein HY698_18035 [Deltaproteobacteria bacterium]|nr:hypothetical protein [Deltaproteobacteria bacterium]